jgi:hypothetical protein
MGMPDPDPRETQPADPSDDRPSEAALLPEVVARRKRADEEARRLDSSVDAHIAEVMQSCRVALEALGVQRRRGRRILSRAISGASPTLRQPRKRK